MTDYYFGDLSESCIGCGDCYCPICGALICNCEEEED